MDLIRSISSSGAGAEAWTGNKNRNDLIDHNHHHNHRVINEEDDEDQMMTTTMMDDLRRGPWTVEEDSTLMNYITLHGEGRWNSLARCAGLKRTGKSCRLRWLNYLRPDVRRGNITLEEQLLILELHSRWGNRWSKIAQHLPGRTDNEIKNYWRTRVQKHAKQLKCDVNSKQFKDTMRYLWMPRLVERINASNSNITDDFSNTSATSHQLVNLDGSDHYQHGVASYTNDVEHSISTTGSSDSFGHQFSPGGVSDLADNYNNNFDYFQNTQNTLFIPSGNYNNTHAFDFEATTDHSNQWLTDFGDASSDEYLWNPEDISFLQQQFANNS